MANIKKNAKGYNYEYTDLAAVNVYIESIGSEYYQEVETTDLGTDYVITYRRDKEETEYRKIRGCKIIDAALSGKNNAAQEAGSGITYARRYSLLMAYGLATTDDDGETYPRPKATQEVRNRQEESKSGAEPFAKAEEPTISKGAATDKQRGFIANLLTQHGYHAAEQKGHLMSEYGLAIDDNGSLIISSADAQMIIDDLNSKETAYIAPDVFHGERE